MRSLSALPTALLVLLSSAISTSATPETLDDGLKIELVSGPVTCDRPTRSHDKIAVHYIGTLESDGTEFDQSYKRGKPFVFVLDSGHVIKGWDEGLQGMCIGQTRKLTIPPELGYGNRGAGAIPPKSTLIFEAKLMDIVQLSPDPEPTTTQEEALTIATSPPTPDGTESNNVHDDEELKEEIVSPDEDENTDPMKDKPKQQTKCHLLGPFALIVQGALGALALLTLVWKRWREVPKRPWKIFFFDVSKQVFGSMLTHVINLTMSELGSIDMANVAAHVATKGKHSGGARSPNPCSFYLLNLGIDTTIGVPVLWFLLKILYRLFLLTPLANPPESIKSGHYGSPPRAGWYLKQLFIYCIGLVGMKLFVFFLFLALPWLPWVGDWALRWTEGNEILQITFALFLFPLAMNAVQYWVIDNFIMDKKKDDNDDKGYQQVAGDDVDEERGDDDATVVEEDVRGKGDQQHLDGRTLKEIDPLPIPSANARSGEGSRKASPQSDDDLKNR